MICIFINMIGNLRGTVQVAEQIAKGDLTVNVKTLSDKDALGNALKNMAKKLRNIMEEINTASSNVAAGSEELSSSSQSMTVGSTLSDQGITCFLHKTQLMLLSTACPKCQQNLVTQ